jgi:hypothetical protein
MWLREGDKNTKFFHKVASSHRRNNQVGSLLIIGSMSTNLMEIKDHIVQFYRNLYSEQVPCRPRAYGLSFRSIDADESLWMEQEFEEEELWAVIREMSGDKAPAQRPNGFTIAFWFLY